MLEPLPAHWYTNDIHSFSCKIGDRGWVGVGVIVAILARQFLCRELAIGDIYAVPFALSRHSHARGSVDRVKSKIYGGAKKAVKRIIRRSPTYQTNLSNPSAIDRRMSAVGSKIRPQDRIRPVTTKSISVHSAKTGRQFDNFWSASNKVAPARR